MSKWMVRQSSADIEQLARSTGLNPVLARILAVRGYRELQAVEAFLHPEQLPLADPLTFADMDKAVEMVHLTIDNQCKCAVFGDYDADGIMSTLIVLTTLRSLGAEAIYYIPQREGEGYGLNNEAVDALHQQGVEVIFACDNGISAFEQVEYASQLGIEIVILDHHAVAVSDQGEQLLPAAWAVVDAKREDCPYPFTEYCAAGLCYRFSEAVYQSFERDWSQLGEQLLPLATIATICDLVELSGENRALVKRGLPSITRQENIGLRTLIQAVGLHDKEIDAYHVGFIIGPCINASGRLAIADTAVELFLATEQQQAQALAEQLIELNRQRRRLTEEGAECAYRIVLEQGLQDDRVIVLYCTEVQESVAGIIAGRIKEHFYRPAVVLVGRGEVVRGSCRSIEGYNIYEGLFACRDLLRSFGGHPMAAGLSMLAADIDQLRVQLNKQAELSDDDLQPQYRIDCPLPLSKADLTLAKNLRLIAPFGKGNPQPLFAAKGLVLQRLTLLGRDEQVLRWQLRFAEGGSCEAIDFSGRRQLEAYLKENFGEQVWADLLSGKSDAAPTFDILYHLSVNKFNGRETPQVQIVDFRAG